MNSEVVSGSSLWQTVFVSFAVLLVLFQVIHGWRLGLPRQLVRIGAIVAAYSAAIFGGSLTLPFLRPLLQLPDIVISALGGAVLALVVYLLINALGRILFKRTGQQQSGLVRLVYGVSGAVLGIFFGLFFIWLLATGIRSIGALAEAQVPVDQLPRAGEVRRAQPLRAEEDSLARSIARMKRSIEMGPVGDVVRQTDVVPTGVYDTLTKTGQVLSRPERANRFFAYPGVEELVNTPQIEALRADPEIARMIEQGRLWELLRDERLIEAANDPELRRRLKNFDLNKALDYAAQE